MRWDDFLRKIAIDFSLSPEQTEVFLIRFSEENKQKPDSQVQKLVEEVLHLDKAAYEKRRGGIYKKIEQNRQNPNGCEEIVSKSPRKAEKLLAWLEKKYTEHREQETIQPVETSGADLNLSDWRKICQELIDHRKWLTTNALTTSGGIRFELNDVFVPLGVVERQQKPKHRLEPYSPERGSEFYVEKVTPISHQDFFEQVLQQKQSAKSQGSRIAIIGEPGAGKTTQLQKIGEWILEETADIPIWISLAEIGTKALRDYLLNDWLRNATQEIEAAPQYYKDGLSQLLKSGRVWLLLDGVDEMSAGDALQQIATQMNEGWLKAVRVVLTCRLNVWDAGKNALDRFDVYRNLDFEYPSEVHQFIDRWFSKELQLGQDLKSGLEQAGRERIRDMVKNPLRLTLLCYSWQLRQGELPEIKAGLYEWFVDAFYEWNKGKVSGKVVASKRQELNRALGELAKEAIDSQSSRFRLTEKFITQFLGDVEDEFSLFYLALQLGWLNRVGVAEENPLENVYAFLHPTFQEYFAVSTIDDWRFFLNHNNFSPNPFLPFNGLDCTYRVFQEEWQEIILFWIGQKDREESERFINALLEFEDGCEGIYYNNAYLSAAHCVLEYSQSEHTLKILESFIWASCSFGGSSESRKVSYKLSISSIEAEKFLKKVKNEQLIAVLKSLLKILDEEDTQDKINFHKKLTIAEMLGESGSQEVIEIINQLVSHPEMRQPYNSLGTILALGKLVDRYPQVVNSLARICEEDESSFSKMIVYSELLKQNDIFSVEDIIKQIDLCGNRPWSLEVLLSGLYKRDPKNKVIINTCVYLLLHGDCDTFYALSWLLEKEEIFQHPNIISTLLEILHVYSNEDREDVHEFCALYLGMAHVNDRSIIPVLINTRDNSWNEHNRFRATKILFELGEIDKTEFSTILFGFLFKFREGPTLGLIAEKLSELYPNDWTIPELLINRMLDPKWGNEIEWFFPSLKKVLQGQLLPIAVTTLKSHLILALKTEGEIHEYINQLLYHCGQNMSYPNFWKAWNNVTYELEQLPLTQRILSFQLTFSDDINLNQAFKLVCIDAKTFISHENPIADIYIEMIDQGCPKASEGRPKTIADFKTYWRLELKQVALIFYNSEQPEQGLSDRFLADLRKLGGAIFVVTDQNVHGLEQVSPNHPVLVNEILRRLRRRLWEE